MGIALSGIKRKLVEVSRCGGDSGDRDPYLNRGGAAALKSHRLFSHSSKVRPESINVAKISDKISTA